jgi:hypothetical protein
MSFNIRPLPAPFLLLLVSACGGGSDAPPATGSGSGSPSGSPSGSSTGNPSLLASVEGAYAGTIGPVEGRALILENGDTWVLSGTSDTNRVFIPVGVSHGQGTLNGTTFQASFESESLTATANGTAISGSQRINADGRSVPISVSKTSVVGYNYSEAASASAIAGTWQVQSGTGGTLVLAPDGALSGVGLSSASCTVAATVTPRASGKNVYNLTGNVTGASCPTAGPINGFAIIYVDALNRQQLLMPIELPGQRAVLRAQRCAAGAASTQCAGASTATATPGTSAATTPSSATPMATGATSPGAAAPSSSGTSTADSLGARVTAAPADGSDGSIICAFPRIEVAGTGMKNVELVPEAALSPVIARFTVSADGTLATLPFDALPKNTTLRVRIVAYDSLPGQPGRMVVAMEARTWNIGNAAEPPCLSPGSQTAS